MLSSNTIAIFFVSLLALTLFSSCAFRRADNETTSPTDFSVEKFRSEIPFAIKEPENFQAEFVVSSGGVDDKTFIARNGANQRYDFNYGDKNQFSVLRTADGKSALLLSEKKIYAENAEKAAIKSADNSLDFLTTEWLNEKPNAKFEKLGAENELTKYRVIFGDERKSEAVVYVDEKINLPVKQEFYSIKGEGRILNFTFEMKNFQPRADAGSFVVPPNFRKVPVEEFRRILQSEN